MMSVLVLVLAASTPVPRSVGWTRYKPEVAPGFEFSFEHPADWKVVSSKEQTPIQISSPDALASLYVGAYSKPDSSLESFAAVKFGVMANIFKAVGVPREVGGSGWKGLLQDGQTSGGDRRVTLCAQHGSTYVSLTLYLDKTSVARREDLQHVFESLKFGN